MLWFGEEVFLKCDVNSVTLQKDLFSWSRKGFPESGQQSPCLMKFNLILLKKDALSFCSNWEASRSSEFKHPEGSKWTKWGTWANAASLYLLTAICPSSPTYIYPPSEVTPDLPWPRSSCFIIARYLYIFFIELIETILITVVECSLHHQLMNSIWRGETCLSVLPPTIAPITSTSLLSGSVNIGLMNE